MVKTILAVTALAVCVASEASAQQPEQAVAHERSFNTINGAIVFNDDGSKLTVNGQATGMTLGLTYVSFIYGPGSKARGTLACLPPSPNNLTAQQMFLGVWLPVNKSVRVLYAVKTGSSYAPLAAFDTASIRYDNAPTVPFGTITPARYVLQTCSATKEAPGDAAQ